MQSIDLQSAAFLWSKVPQSSHQGQELEESLVFPLGGLGVGVGDRPLANPSAPQPSTVVSVMMTSGAGSWGWEGESCCSEACLPPNRGSAPSYPVACYSACNPTIRVMLFGLRQQVSIYALQGPLEIPSPSGAEQLG